MTLLSLRRSGSALGCNRSFFGELVRRRLFTLFPFTDLPLLRPRGTTNVGEKSLKAIVDGKHDLSLKILNLSSTSIKPVALVDVLARCLGLEELKLAYLQAFVSLFSPLPSKAPNDSARTERQRSWTPPRRAPRRVS